MSHPDRNAGLRHARAGESPAHNEATRSGRWVGYIDGVCDVLAAPRPLPVLVAASFFVSALYVAWVFGRGFILGASDFWHNPHGIIRDSWGDIFTSLSGYLFFQHDVWRFPLFHVAKLGAPGGFNVIFTDSIPWLALAGRLTFLASGVSVNLFGLWTAFCFCAAAMSLTALVAALGQRGLAAAAAATIAGLCMPELLSRWGHVALLAQFELVLALLWYIHACRSDTAARTFLQATALTLLALGTTPYIFAMVSAIIFAGIAQAVTNRALALRTAAVMLAGLAVLLLPVMILSGFQQSHGDLAGGGFGIYSMNALSPIVPQRSGLFAPLRDLVVDATGGQYEGLSYLGGGTLLLLIATLSVQWRFAWRALRVHPWLWALFILSTVYALSNIVYLGKFLVLELPLPRLADQLTSIFRSGGRCFWPVMYCLTALAIAAVIPLFGRRGVLLLCVAIPLQWIDSGPLREAVMSSVRSPSAAPLDFAPWLAAIGRHRSVTVIPPSACIKDKRGWNNHVAQQLQLLAAIADRSVNSIFVRNIDTDCDIDQRIDTPPRSGSQALFVFLDESQNFARMRARAGADAACRASDRLVVCSDLPGEAAALEILALSGKR